MGEVCWLRLADVIVTLTKVFHHNSPTRTLYFKGESLFWNEAPPVFWIIVGQNSVHKELLESSSKDGKTGWPKCHQTLAGTMGDTVIEDTMLWLAHALLSVISVCGGRCVPAARTAAELSLYKLAALCRTLG